MFVLLTKNLKNYKHLLPEVFWSFVDQAGVAVAGLLGIKLLTHFLNSSEFGHLALANSLIALIGVNLFGPLRQGLMRFWSISRKNESLNDFYAVSNVFTKYICYGLFCLSIIVLIFLWFFVNVNWSIIVVLALMIGVFNGIFSLRIGVFLAARQRRRIAILNIFSTFCKFLFATVFVIALISKANIALLGYLSASILSFLVAQKLYIRTTSKRMKNSSKTDVNSDIYKDLRREILSYSWPFFIWGMFGWINVSSDRWALQTFYGPDMVGNFAVVSQLACYPVLFLFGLLTSFFTPIAFQRAGDLKQKKTKNSAYKMLLFMTGIYIVVVFILVCFFMFFHTQLILFFSNARFLAFSYLLPGLTIAWALFCLGNLFASFGFLVKKTKDYIVPKIVTYTMTACLTFFLCFKYGPVGVVWGLALPRFFYALWCGSLAVKFIKMT